MNIYTVIDNRQMKYILFTHSKSNAYKCAKENSDFYISEFTMNESPVEHRLYLDIEEFRKEHL